MPQPQRERRSKRRFDLRLPLAVRVAGETRGELLTETQNISAEGIFFYLHRPLAQGSRIDLAITLPAPASLTGLVRPLESPC